jgi:hypothetical protein
MLKYKLNGKAEQIVLEVAVEPGSLLLYADAPNIGRVWGLTPDAIINHIVAFMEDEGAEEMEVKKYESLYDA